MFGLRLLYQARVPFPSSEELKGPQQDLIESSFTQLFSEMYARERTRLSSEIAQAILKIADTCQRKLAEILSSAFHEPNEQSDVISAPEIDLSKSLLPEQPVKFQPMKYGMLTALEKKRQQYLEHALVAVRF